MAKIYHTLVNPDTLPSLKQRQTWLECAEKKTKQNWRKIWQTSRLWLTL